MRVAFGLIVVVVAALVLAASAGTATADKPVAGAEYTYKKTLKKWKQWTLAEPPYNILTVEVDKFGTTVRVGWSLYTGHDCIRRSSSGATVPYQDGTIIERIPVKPDGSFHGVQRPRLGTGVKYSLFEVRGRFLSQGASVQVSIRHRFYGSLYGAVERCGGKWVTFRAALDK